MAEPAAGSDPEKSFRRLSKDGTLFVSHSRRIGAEAVPLLERSFSDPEDDEQCSEWGSIMSKSEWALFVFTPAIRSRQQIIRIIPGDEVIQIFQGVNLDNKTKKTSMHNISELKGNASRLLMMIKKIRRNSNLA